MRRFKTGTPARMDKRSLDFSKMEEQLGDEKIVPFSFSTDPESVQKEQASCWLTYTNENTHEIIRNNLDRSPIYAGIIEGTGPRSVSYTHLEFCLTLTGFYITINMLFSERKAHFLCAQMLKNMFTFLYKKV